MRAPRLALWLLAAPLWWAAPARAADYCAGGHATALLLVDRTTAFDKTDRAVFLDAVSNLIAQLGSGDRLVGYTITGDYTESAKVFDQCKPGCPDDGFLGNLFSTCSPLAARVAFRAFQGGLATALAALLREPQETRYSDIFRTVAEATRAQAADGKPLRTLIVFSDLIENSPMFPEREFRHAAPGEAARRLAAAQVVPRLTGASVRVFGFGRDDAPGRPALPQEQRRSMQAIWDAWFRGGGAAEVQIGFR